MGIPKVMVDSWIEDKVKVASMTEEADKKAVDDRDAKVLEHVGGQAEFDKMGSWAVANMDEADITKLNEALAHEDVRVAQFAAASLKEKYTAATGSAPKNQLSGNAGGTEGIKPFATEADWQKAMSSKKYQNDADYREEVGRRMANSPALFS